MSHQQVQCSPLSDMNVHRDDGGNGGDYRNDDRNNRDMDIIEIVVKIMMEIMKIDNVLKNRATSSSSHQHLIIMTPSTSSSYHHIIITYQCRD
jgi:hypothetical protein